MVCKRVYSADGVKLKARHITAIPQGTGSSSSMSWLLKVTSNRQQKITLQEMRLGVFLIKKNISSLSNNKAVKAATEKVRSNGKRLSVDQKNAIRKENATTRKNAHKINNKIERENAVKNKFFDWTYGTHKYYEEKTR